MKSVELFAGAGGLAIGLGLAGFENEIVIEWDRWACDTIRQNQSLGYPLVQDWNVFEGDARNFRYDQIEGEIDLVSGGPPCQPFSLGGKHRGMDDSRNMFPIAIDVVRRLRPRAFIFENVKGLTRSSFANYFQYILLQLSFPEICRRQNEEWHDHLGRLEKHKTKGKIQGLSYNVVTRVLNAADYGVPQRRERVLIVGFRNDQNKEWAFPRATHSFKSLLYEQCVTGEYWERHRVAKRKIPNTNGNLSDRASKITDYELFENGRIKPWLTIRDAFAGLPDPTRPYGEIDFYDHKFQPGAKSYPGHTGSPLDLPAKALKAGDHGVPGGENMLVLPDGNVRYFTIRESARLQTFPDGYRFHGSWTEAMRQLGNAVPVSLAKTVGISVISDMIAVKESEIRYKALRGRHVS